MQVRNWGRWGADDEIGTLNFITPEAVAAASRLAPPGKVFALGIPLQREGPQSGTRQRFNPIHTMFRDGSDVPKTPAEVVAMQGYGGSDDWIVMPLQCVTQWDSLAHVFYEGKMYNGYDAALVTSSGAARNSIDKTRSRLVGRGVLLDVARHRGVRALEPGYAITVADLEATAAAESVEVGPGDILLVRTGHMSRYLDRKDWRHFDLDPFPGVSVHTAPWLHARQVAAIASDNYARWRYGPRRSRASATRSTSWRSPTWASPWGRSSSWKSWPTTARPTAATPSCSSRRPCRSSGRWGRRSTRTR
jgi:hypothetical protein